MSHRSVRHRSGPIATAALALLIMFAVFATFAEAVDLRGASWIDNWLAQPQLMGNGFGARAALAGWGITPIVRYGPDMQANVLGGQRRGKAYAGDFAIDVTVDLEKLSGARGLTFGVSGDWTSGTNLLLGEQMVYRDGGAGSVRGLSLFGALIYAPPQRINTMPWFASAGASYRGLVPGRDKDTAGFALYYGGFSRDLPGQTYELVLEWTYAIALTRWLTIQPDVQYVINPGGRSSVGNAVVVGAPLAVEF